MVPEGPTIGPTGTYKVPQGKAFFLRRDSLMGPYFLKSQGDTKCLLRDFLGLTGTQNRSHLRVPRVPHETYLKCPMGGTLGTQNVPWGKNHVSKGLTRSPILDLDPPVRPSVRPSVCPSVRPSVCRLSVT